MADSNGQAEPPPSARNPLEQLRDLIGVPIDDDFGDIPTPTRRPELPSADAADEWDLLRVWVEGLCRRFSHLDHHVIPRCWWRHNGHVEALAALRDHERSSFADTAPATAPVDWFRALRDLTALLKAWTADLGCGASHQSPPATLRSVEEDEWQTFAQADITARQQKEIQHAVQ
jgi:hypothetical protein